MLYKKGFTLLELLVVIALISLISSIIFTSLSSVRAKSRDAKRISEAGSLRMALEMNYNSQSVYIRGTPPPGSPGWNSSCDSAWTATAAGNNNNYLMRLVERGYISVLPVDPLNSGAYCYWYFGNGDDFKIAVHMEDSGNRTQYAANDNGVCAEWYEIFTAGAQNKIVGGGASCP